MMKSFYYLVLLLLLVSIETGQSLQVMFKPCGGQVEEVRVSGCRNETEPCIVERGTKAKLEVDFKAPFDSDYVYAGVTSDSFWRFPVPIPTLDSDACQGHGLKCPIEKGKLYTYFYEIYVSPMVPKVKGEYFLSLTTYWGYTVACFSLPLEVV